MNIYSPPTPKKLSKSINKQTIKKKDKHQTDNRKQKQKIKNENIKTETDNQKQKQKIKNENR